MKKMTLLEMVQNIASALETDEVNSITDTTESLMIAEVVKETFYEQFNNIIIPEFQQLTTLDSYSDVDTPNYLVIPETVNKIFWIRYKDFRNGDKYDEVDYLPPDEFMQKAFQNDTTMSDVSSTVDPSSGVIYLIKNNRRPTYYTAFDDQHLAFDSYDADSEATLEGGNCIVFASKSPEFLMEDAFVPPLDATLFPLLLAESKSTCFINLKQVSSSKEEQKARRQRIRMQNDQFKARSAQYNWWNRGNNFSRTRG